MLRRLKPISLSADDMVDEPVAPATPLPQREDEAVERSPYATGAQLRMDLDQLREAQLKMSPGEDGGRFAIRNIVKPRMLLLAVAVIAGGMAAFLAVRSATPAAPAEEVAIPTAAPVAAPVTRVLVASKDINIGQRLTDASVAWQEWPEAALRPEFITDAAMPEAPTDMSGAVARYAFFSGEPIRRQKLVMADQGYLSAVLEPGKRGVSVSVNAEAASGGFIVPDDHVDVVLAYTSMSGQQLTQTILSNVRVIAINAQLGDTAPPDPAATPESRVFAGQALATLELDQQQAEIITNATVLGKLSLVLRSLTDFDDKSVPASANQAIRLTSRFWTN